MAEVVKVRCPKCRGCVELDVITRLAGPNEQRMSCVRCGHVLYGVVATRAIEAQRQTPLPPTFTRPPVDSDLAERVERARKRELSARKAAIEQREREAQEARQAELLAWRASLTPPR
jgi:hypothetical protein